ncbi:TetR/AcrR family transcriptional regulator [Streptomyces sp. ACA25]|uniref:TetR/AcrR family transcriptional regulator n=1 Tax=Streptomyces sp. ACA25 TaxID=3022596 RepID=UPI002307EDC9|nr:TetR/AcrR family transcriptional regulator [Streptomyces sp. ACA25]MDB1089748.1 TetR/AcrR family transcriptional regulator [Streptomyces sp. ACA25]
MTRPESPSRTRPEATPGTTPRTRRAILDAAITVYAQDRAASLREIAEAAEVSRSTLHRYFADRSALVDALADDAMLATRQALVDAALDEDTPAEAFRRLVRTFFDLGPRMDFLFGETQLPDDKWQEGEWEAAHAPVGALFLRGQEAGVFDRGIDADWFVRTIWYLTSAGWEAVGEGIMSKHQAAERVIRTLERGLLAPDA